MANLARLRTSRGSMSSPGRTRKDRLGPRTQSLDRCFNSVFRHCSSSFRPVFRVTDPPPGMCVVLSTSEHVPCAVQGEPCVCQWSLRRPPHGVPLQRHVVRHPSYALQHRSVTPLPPPSFLRQTFVADLPLTAHLRCGWVRAGVRITWK